MRAPWKVIDALVDDIGDLSAHVHLAERTLASDPRTAAARHAFERATEAVLTAIDQTSAVAAGRATTAIEDTRALLAQLGVTIGTTRALVSAAEQLLAESRRRHHRADLVRRRRPHTRKHKA